jgi:hypothetical protein
MTNQFHSEIGFEALMVVIISMVVFDVVTPGTFVGGHQLLEEQASSIFIAEDNSQISSPRWSQNLPLKHCHPPTSLLSVTTQKTTI